LRDLARLRERFVRDEPAVRLGNLASDLKRLSTWVNQRRSDGEVIDLIREVAWMMEWPGDLALPDLADMQRELCRWRSIWPLRVQRAAERASTSDGIQRRPKRIPLLQDDHWILGIDCAHAQHHNAHVRCERHLHLLLAA
jgi:hypothetical protein